MPILNLTKEEAKLLSGMVVDDPIIEDEGMEETFQSLKEKIDLACAKACKEEERD